MRTLAVCFVFGLFSCVVSVAQGLTRIDIRTQSRNHSFVDSGTTLPGMCRPGDLFLLKPVGSNGVLMVCSEFQLWGVQGLPTLTTGTRTLSSDGGVVSWTAVGGDLLGPFNTTNVVGLRGRPVAPTAPSSGQALMWDGSNWKPQFPGAPGTNTITVKSGVYTAVSTALNFVPGSGLLLNLLENGTETRIQPTLDTAVVATRSHLQSNQSLLCAATAGALDAYTCSMAPTLNSYQTGMLIHWKPNTAPGGTTPTLAVDSLTAKSIKLSDGLSDPTVGDIRSGELYPLWYDGTVFRLLRSPMITLADTRPTCDASLRGRVWHLAGGAGDKDLVALCAKDESDQYDWRALY